MTETFQHACVFEWDLRFFGMSSCALHLRVDRYLDGPRWRARRQASALFAACTLVLLANLAAVETNPPPASLPELRGRLSAHFSQPRYAAARWGVRIISLDTGENLFDLDADKLMVPASNAKLFTGALALDTLGPEFRTKTSVWSTAGADQDGLLSGDLIVRGQGDPTFVCRLHPGDPESVFGLLVDAIQHAGVHRVHGDLIADETYFRGPTLGSGWEWDDLLYGYGAEVSALSFNDNAVELTVLPGGAAGDPPLVRFDPSPCPLEVINAASTGAQGSARELLLERLPDTSRLRLTGRIPLGDPGYTETVAVPHPALWFGQMVREALLRRGIIVEGQVRVSSVGGSTTGGSNVVPRVELGSVTSPPLRDSLGLMLKPSQNLHAQLLLLHAGATQSGAGQSATSEAAGLRALSMFLRKAGIGLDAVRLEEGSGLSRHDLVTANATVRLLQFMSQHPHAEVFRAALPLAGVDGTLKTRMRGTPAAGNARAKTGSMSGVHSLSGYVTSAAGEHLAFAFYLNQYFGQDPNRSARTDLDAVVVMLAQLPWRSQKP